ncbi:MAG: GNAT family N-acetyltransferase, partial [Candidatus Bathyarchaeota archaeon]|nr:GNAT family N-acetyltransferase [Candidatus Bathyarchaeota archaeon]
MPFECEPSLFERTRSLWRNMGLHLAVESILGGKTTTRMFVDDLLEPHAAMTWTGHRLYIAGHIEYSGFRETLREEYINENNPGTFIAYCSPEAIEGTERLLSDYRVKRRNRFYYTVNPSTHKWVVKPPKGYVIHPITGALLAKNFVNTEQVIEEMTSERSSAEEFLEKSFGFVAVYSGKIVCWCMSEYNIESRCEVGIETTFEHRRTGLARLVAGAMFGYTASVGVKLIGWHCWADNLASAATAEKLYLTRVAEYPVLS